MYAEDSFHTLSLLGQIGLVALSLLLACLLALASWRLGLRRRAAIRIALALCLLYLFVWFSPQVYYLYYLTLFEGLPWQIVIKSPPSPVKLLMIMTFQDEATLSAHGKGLLGWCLVAAAALGDKAPPLWLGRRRRRSPEIHRSSDTD